MIAKKFIKRISLILTFILFIILSALTIRGHGYASPNTSYKYEKKDVEAEQKKFIVKPVNDKKKCAHFQNQLSFLHLIPILQYVHKYYPDYSN